MHHHLRLVKLGPKRCSHERTHVPVLDHTIQLTNVWLKRLGEEHHLGDRHNCYSALRAALHALRDRLTPEVAVHLGVQLPSWCAAFIMRAGTLQQRRARIGKSMNL